MIVKYLFNKLNTNMNILFTYMPIIVYYLLVICIQNPASYKPRISKIGLYSLVICVPVSTPFSKYSHVIMNTETHSVNNT